MKSKNPTGVMNPWAIRSQTEVATMMGLSPAMVSYIERKALAKLRKRLNEELTRKNRQ